MRSTAMKFGIAGLGLYVVSRLLKSVSDASASFAPRGMQGYEQPMLGYDPLSEALGCSGGGSFEDSHAEGLGFSLKKSIKKATSSVTKIAKKPLKIVKRDLKKGANIVKRDFKRGGSLVKRDFSKATQPLVRDFRKAGKLMKTDFSRAGAMFGKKKSGGGGDDAPQQYFDENGNELTEAQYNALMAQYEREYASQSPANEPAGGADQENTPEQTWSMDETAAIQFEQQETRGDGADEILAQMFQSDGNDLQPVDGDQFNTWERAPIGYDESFDPLASPFLPIDQREHTMDLLATESTADDSIIMPADEPAVPYSADEFMVAYERPDSVARGESWEPDAEGSNYGNVSQGPDYVPGYDEGYDWGGTMEGLGDVVAHPHMHGIQRPSRMVVLDKKQGRVIPILADKKGNCFCRNGGSMVPVGHVDNFANGPGTGWQMFGRLMGGKSTAEPAALNGWSDFLKKAESTSKKVASRATPSGFLYERLKKNPKLYREYRKGAKVAMPYVMIVGGVVVSVASVGVASPAGAAMIAGGVASAGAQAYSDVKNREVMKAEEKALDAQIEADRIQEAIDSGGTIQESYGLEPSGGPAAGEIPGGDWPNQYPGDGVWADFLDLTESLY